MKCLIFQLQGRPDDDYESELPPLPQEDDVSVSASNQRCLTADGKCDAETAPNELSNLRTMVGPGGKLFKSQADVMKALLGMGSTIPEED